MDIKDPWDSSRQKKNKQSVANSRLSQEIFESIATSPLFSDEKLCGYLVQSVEHSGWGNTYYVFVSCIDSKEVPRLEEARAFLKAHTGLLRRELLQRINRKNLPNLVIEMVPPELGNG